MKKRKKCIFCEKAYRNKIKCARHERIVHADEKCMPVYRCSFCSVTRVNYMKLKSTSPSFITSFQIFVIFVICLRRQKHSSRALLSFTLGIGKINNNNSCNNNKCNNKCNEKPSQSRRLEAVSILVVS